MGFTCLHGLLYIHKRFHNRKARNLPKLKLTGIFFGVAFIVVIIIIIIIIILMSIVRLSH